MTSLRQRYPNSVKPESLQLRVNTRSTAREIHQNASYLRRSSSSSFLGSNQIVYGIVLTVVLAPWIYQMKLQMDVSEAHDTLDMIRRQQHIAQRELRWASQKLKMEKSEAEEQDKVKKHIVQDLLRMGDNINMDTAEYAKAEQMEENYFKRLDDLHQSISSAGARHLERLGHSSEKPLRLRVTLDERSAQSGTDDKPSFVIEMAPLAVAPHAASHFVRMVQAKLFDGLMLLHRNTGSSTIIHSAAIESKTGNFDEERFEKASLTELSFQEHSKDYLNEKYSAVFSSQGPHFYINMGSGNSTDETDDSESCFGRVVEGQDFLDEVMNAHLKTKSLSMLGIESIQLEGSEKSNMNPIS